MLILKKILIICGKGNNGQDGLSIAANIQNEYEVKTVLLNDSIDYSRYELSCKVVGKENLNNELNNCDVIVDCIFGFSFHLPLNDEYRNIITSVNKAHKTVISIDINSGAQCDDGLYDEAVFSEYTFILGARKHVHDISSELSSKQILIDIFQ